MSTASFSPIVPSIVFLEAIKTINTVQVKSKQYFVQSVKYITLLYRKEISRDLNG